MSEWPKYRILGADGKYDVQIAWGNEGLFRKRPRWLRPVSRVGCDSFDTVGDAELWCKNHKRQHLNSEIVVKVIE